MSSRTTPTNGTPSKHDATGTKLLGVTAHTLEIHADYAVWDTVSNAYLIEGKDFHGSELFRK